MNVIETSGLGTSYGATWVLLGCLLAIPVGHVPALVGPDGALKTTLLNLAVGLTLPSAGMVTVFDNQPAGSPAPLARHDFIAMVVTVVIDHEMSVVVGERSGEMQTHLLIRTNGTTNPAPSGSYLHSISLEELILSSAVHPSSASSTLVRLMSSLCVCTPLRGEL